MLTQPETAPILRSHTFDCPTARLRVYDRGANITDWTPTGYDPVIWVSRMSLSDGSVPINGGIHVCLPWFGPGRDGDRPYIHGFARDIDWTLSETIVTDKEIHLKYTFESLGRKEFPSPFRASLTIVAGQSLRMALSVTNTGDLPLTFEEALHPYLRVGDIRQAKITGLRGSRYIDKTDHNLTRTLRQDLLFTKEIDYVFSSSSPVELHDPAGGRTLTFTKAQSSSTVVWNPGPERVRDYPDFGNDEWPSMVCVEAANSFSHSPTAAPGATHTMCLEISVHELN